MVLVEELVELDVPFVFGGAADPYEIYSIQAMTGGLAFVSPSAAKEGGWADPGAPFSIDGANADGSVPGPCPLNCSNDSEIYSFHSTGANVVFADGSVHSISNSIPGDPNDDWTVFPLDIQNYPLQDLMNPSDGFTINYSF